MPKRVPFTPGDLTDHQHGTDDILTGVNFSANILIGDAGGSMFDHSKGGDDTFIGGVNPAGGPNTPCTVMRSLTCLSMLRAATTLSRGRQEFVTVTRAVTCRTMLRAATTPSRAGSSRLRQ